MTANSEPAPSKDGDPALRAAIQWNIRLEENPDDPALRADFERWLAQDPEHRAAWSHADHVLGLIGQAKSVAFLPRAGVRPAPAAPPGRRPRRIAAAAAAAAAIAATLLAAIFLPAFVQRAQADYATGPGQERLVTLDDGSTVRLAPGSAIQVAYAGARRGVRLMSGEAYFEVAPEPARPFKVELSDANVTVLGTGFNVRLGAAGADIAVRHGRVRVDYAEGQMSAVLAGGEWLQLAWNGPAADGRLDPALVGGWTADRIVAIDRPLSEVIADVRRYYRGAIVLTDSSMGDRIVTGAYDTADPARMVGLIVQPIGGKVTRVTPWLLVVSPS